MDLFLDVCLIMVFLKDQNGFPTTKNKQIWKPTDRIGSRSWHHLHHLATVEWLKPRSSEQSNSSICKMKAKATEFTTKSSMPVAMWKRVEDLYVFSDRFLDGDDGSGDYEYRVNIVNFMPQLTHIFITYKWSYPISEDNWGHNPYKWIMTSFYKFNACNPNRRSGSQGNSTHEPEALVVVSPTHLWNMLVKIGSSSPNRDEIKKICETT